MISTSRRTLILKINYKLLPWHIPTVIVLTILYFLCPQTSASSLSADVLAFWFTEKKAMKFHRLSGHLPVYLPLQKYFTFLLLYLKISMFLDFPFVHWSPTYLANSQHRSSNAPPTSKASWIIFLFYWIIKTSIIVWCSS